MVNGILKINGMFLSKVVDCKERNGLNTEENNVDNNTCLRINRMGIEPRDFTKSDAVAMGKRIRREREALGLTQLELAVDIDVSERTITGLERGEVSPKFEVIRKLSDHFGVSIDYLAEGNVEDNQEYVMKTIFETIKPVDRPYFMEVLQVMVKWADSRKMNN